MIDTHCHILPDLDDGARDLPAALEMARLAVADGIDTVLATPHWSPSPAAPRREYIVERTATLRAALAEAGIPLRVEPGAEVALVAGVIEAAEEGTLPCLAGSRHVLVEVPPAAGWEVPRRVLFELQLRGYRVIVAHPERMPVLLERPERAEELTAGGVKLQVTRGGLTGLLSWRVSRLAKRLVAGGLATLLASDAHSPADGPRLTPARKLVTRLGGPGAFKRMTTGAPAEILQADA